MSEENSSRSQFSLTVLAHSSHNCPYSSQTLATLVNYDENYSLRS